MYKCVSKKLLRLFCYHGLNPIWRSLIYCLKKKKIIIIIITCAYKTSNFNVNFRGVLRFQKNKELWFLIKNMSKNFYISYYETLSESFICLTFFKIKNTLGLKKIHWLLPVRSVYYYVSVRHVAGSREGGYHAVSMDTTSRCHTPPYTYSYQLKIMINYIDISVNHIRKMIIFR